MIHDSALNPHMQQRQSRSKPEDFATISTSVNAILDKHPPICLALVFGSASSERLTAASDIDIAIAAQRPLSVDERAVLNIELSNALGREVDLIDLHQVTGLILQQALLTGRTVKKTDTEVYAGLLKKMLYNQADMMPYHRRILEKRSREWLQP
ncbi:MAG: nucleotidyltransferase domain-containing protein [Desulfuromonas sp.]